MKKMTLFFAMFMYTLIKPFGNLMKRIKSNEQKQQKQQKEQHNVMRPSKILTLSPTNFLGR